MLELSYLLMKNMIEFSYLHIKTSINGKIIDTVTNENTSTTVCIQY